MARNLVTAGLPTAVWDRSAAVTAPLGEAGALVAGSPGEAVRDAGVVITMLPAADAVESMDTARLAEAIEGGPLDAPIADAKLHKIEQEDFAPEFPLQWALKDVDLAIGASDGAALPLLDALSRQWHAAVDAGHGRQDVSAARLALGTPQHGGPAAGT